MSLGSIHIAPHRTHPASPLRLIAFWLGFAALLMLAILALAAPSQPRFASNARPAAPGAPRNQGEGLFGILFDVEPTPAPSDTPQPDAPTDTPLPPPPPTNTPVDTPIPADTLVPLPTDEPTQEPPPTDIPQPTSTFGPTDTPVPVPTIETPVTPTDPPPTNTPDTPEPTLTLIPDNTDLPPATATLPVETPIPAITPSDTPVLPTDLPTLVPTSIVTETPPSATPIPTIGIIFATPVRPNNTATPTDEPSPTTEPTVDNTPTPELLITAIISRTRLPTRTSTVIPMPVETVTNTGTPTVTNIATPTPDLTVTAFDINATATANTANAQSTAKAAIATAGAAIATARSTDPSQDAIATAISARETAEAALATVIPAGIQMVPDTPEPVFEKAVTATLAANAGAPILVYTYTQQINANGEHIVAVCVWNLGTVAGTDIDVQFNSRLPAAFTAGRVPSEQSEFDDQQVKVRIANLSPQTLRQIEVGVVHVDAPLPQWVTVKVPSAYSLDHPGDPPFPADCTPAQIQSEASNSREVELAVGGSFEEINSRIRSEQERVVPPSVFSMTMREQGPAFSSFVLYCVIGLILALLLVVSLLAGERRRRVKPTKLGVKRSTPAR